MKINVYLISKSILFFIITFAVFSILEYGFAPNELYKFITPFLLSILSTAIFLKRDLKRYILTLSVACLGLMILISFLNLDAAKVIGNFGFSLLLIVIVLYLPEIIKKGYIERF